MIHFKNLFDNRVNQGVDHYAGLTGLRGFAVFWVFMFHAWVMAPSKPVAVRIGFLSVPLTPFFTAGWAGVDLLFTLSGFLLTLPFAEAMIKQKKEPGLAGYFLRRVLRIFPAYYGQLAILLLLAGFGIYGMAPGISNVLVHLFMIHNISFEYFQALNGIWWTLPVFFSFYLVFPILIAILRKHHWLLLLVGSIVLALSYRYVMFQFVANKPVNYIIWVLDELPGRIDQFVFGMVGAYFFTKYRRPDGIHRILPVLSMILGVLGIAVCFYLLYLHQQVYWQGHWLFFVWPGCLGLFSTLLFCGIASNCSLSRLFFGNRYMVFTGVISYSLYLWHFLLIDWILKSNLLSGVKEHVFLKFLAVSLPLVFVISIVSYLIFEKPFLGLRARGRAG
jgi:peptidoglycan/LPS O-acetylase OafA/YrhL